jgi:hypothetical protein
MSMNNQYRERKLSGSEKLGSIVNIGKSSSRAASFPGTEMRQARTGD